MKIELLQDTIQTGLKHHPNKTAAQYDDKHMTYRQLESTSNKLANLLFDSGFKSKSAVLICQEKSIESIVSFLAVLKAGGCYIPVDRLYSPVNRIIDIIKHSESKYIITNTRYWGLLHDHIKKEETIKDITVLFTDLIFQTGVTVQKNFAADNVNNTTYRSYRGSLPDDFKEAVHVEPSDLAYILYTSGSTGVPKGVMITHRNAATFINWCLSYFNPKETDVFSNHAPLHFDLSVFDLYVALAVGATVQMVPFEITKNPRALLKWISDRKITYWYSVPTVWISILNYAKIAPGKMKDLQNIIFAGETFPAKYLKRLMRTIPDSSYYNLYGPTETNVCTYYRVPSIDSLTDQPPPIGQTCGDAEIFILDDELKPVAVGESGALHIKGDTVTPGYYKEPEKTRRVFVQSPFVDGGDSLLYNTGDIVERIDDVNFRYIGRKDLMVKYSGFRVELQEIETVLLKHDDVEETVVVPVINGDGDVESLLAYLTLTKDARGSALSFKRYLSKVLPLYMIPEIMNIVEEIPKNANGKIDRQKAALLARSN